MDHRDEHFRSRFSAAGRQSAVEELRSAARDFGVEITTVLLDGEGRVQDSDSGRADQVEFLWCHGRFTGAWVNRAIESLPNLKWVHSDFVGIDAMPVDKLAARGIEFTNGGGNFARPMAEWSVMGLLASAKRFGYFHSLSQSGIWDPSLELTELAGKKLFLVGLGSVNRLVAAMVAPFDMSVSAWSRTRKQEPVPGVDHLYWGDDVPDEMQLADYIVVGVPLTTKTRRMFNAELLGKLKKGVTVVNPARGAIFNEVALAEAIDSGQVGYALLDAFEAEPLPEDSPLWRNPRVTVYPHHSWSSPNVTGNAVVRMRSQLALWLKGEQLDGLVDLEAGY